MQSAVVIYESMTGNTRSAAERIAEALGRAGVPAVACPIGAIDYAALAAADMVVVGSWTDGLFVVGQRPGRAGRLWRLLPAIDRKQAAVFCTYAINPGRTLDKLADLVAARGGEVLGGYAIRRDRIEEGAETFVERLVAAAATADGDGVPQPSGADLEPAGTAPA